MLERLLSRKYATWFRELSRGQRARLELVAKSLLGRRYQPSGVARYAREWVRFLASDRRGRPLPGSIHSPEVRQYLMRRAPGGSANRFRVRGALRLLLEADEQGRCRTRMCHPPGRRAPLSELLVPDYVAFLGTRDVTPHTRRHTDRMLGRFAEFLRRRRISSWGRVDLGQVRAFLTGLDGIGARTRSSYAICLRGFFRWAFVQGEHPRDLSSGIPTSRHYRLARLPDVLAAQEVSRLLSAVDRSSAYGRRDYALALLAARYGMRPSDIRRLTLDNIDWDNRRIVLEQSKTGRALALPLLRDVAAALRVYIRKDRPQTESRVIFVRHKAPFEPFCPANAFSQVMKNVLAAAGLGDRKGGRGLYLFRHTLATRLLSQGESLKTIGDILGHATSQSTLIYTKVDLPALRGVAISIGEVLA